MRMHIQAWRDGVPQAHRCMAAAQNAVSFLEEIASSWDECKLPACSMPEPPHTRHLLHVMWQSTREIGDPDLTPMAAVAGTIADAVADVLREAGMTRVIVNNGGDLALRLSPGESIVVGVRPKVDHSDISGCFVLHGELGIGGVCTSGLGGRSFTRGIASAATVLAQMASCADAAATAIANATFINSPAVHRAAALNLDPSSDLHDLEVTTSVDCLSDKEASSALDQGIARAEKLVTKGRIAGAIITVQGRTRWTQTFPPILEKNVPLKKESS